jgi:hypothetical protein
MLKNRQILEGLRKDSHWDLLQAAATDRHRSCRNLVVTAEGKFREVAPGVAMDNLEAAAVGDCHLRLEAAAVGDHNHLEAAAVGDFGHLEAAAVGDCHHCLEAAAEGDDNHLGAAAVGGHYADAF